MKDHWREVTIILLLITSFVAMMFLDAIHQNPSYHNFADGRMFLGIPNFFNVISNIPFAIFGIVGTTFCLRNRQEDAHWSWVLFFSGVIVVCFGSAYYHLHPNNFTLVWDRLPMTVGFMGLFIGLMSEYVNPRIERMFLIPAIILGFSSVIYWQFYDDLRFYFWIQLIPLLTIPVVLIVFEKTYTHQRFLIFALAIYLFAKVTEAYDREIFQFTDEQLGGHSMKHILAALGVFSIYLFLKKQKRRKLSVLADS